MTDIIIIGGGAAGLTAAMYAARAGKSVKVLEAAVFGGQITMSPRVENYPAYTAISGNEFADKLVEQVLLLGVETVFTHVDKIEKTKNGFCVLTGDGTETCRAVVLATGARHRPLGLAREEDFVGEGVSYCAVCDGSFYQNKKVAVVGGGSAALQEALYLSAIAAEVTLIHRRDTFRGEERLAEKLRTVKNVKFIFDTVVEELLGESELSGLSLHNVKSGARTTLSVDGLFVAVGQIADNEAYRDLVALADNDFIDAGESCKTSCEGIFAAGDCRNKTVRQLTTAVGDGAVAATEAVAYLERL